MGRTKKHIIDNEGDEDGEVDITSSYSYPLEVNKEQNSEEYNPALTLLSSTVLPLPPRTIGGIRDQLLRLKTCNCKRSHCLKLYCECFAAGIYCSPDCRCKNCKNIEGLKSEDNQTGWDDRSVAIKNALERNPHAFRPRAMTISNTVPIPPQVSISSPATTQQGKHSSNHDPHNPPKSTIWSMKPNSVNSTTGNAGDMSGATGATSLSSATQQTVLHSKSNTSKLGCNCRKSFCLKKYCECFQASIYCSSQCRCQSCQNKPGNPKREALLKKSRKKDEEKESLAYAAFKLTGQQDENGLDDITSRVAVRGVPPSAAAMMAAGVAASGVDVFLPPSSYAVPMKLETGRQSEVIAFGTVGRQIVGGAIATEEQMEESRGREVEKMYNSMDKSEHVKGDKIQMLPKETLKALKGVNDMTMELNLHMNAIKDVLCNQKVHITHEKESNNENKINTSSMWNKKEEYSDCKAHDRTLGEPSTALFDIADNIFSTPPRAREATKNYLNSIQPIQAKKRSYAEFANKTISNISSEIHQIQTAMVDSDQKARDHFDSLIQKKRKDGTLEEWFGEDTETKTETHGTSGEQESTCNERNDSTQSDLHCNEQLDEVDIKRTKISKSVLKDLFVLAEQDSAMLHELANIIRGRALALTRRRKEHQEKNSQLNQQHVLEEKCKMEEDVI